MSPSKKNKWYGLKEQMVRVKKTNGTGKKNKWNGNLKKNKRFGKKNITLTLVVFHAISSGKKW